MSASAVLDVEEITVRFGGIMALDRASFSIEQGQICGLIGPNGAGKTTLFNVISRIYDPSSGQITFEGKDLLRSRPHQISKLGIFRTFQNLALWPGLTVLENVMVGAHSKHEGQLRHRPAAPRHPRRGAQDRRALLRAAAAPRARPRSPSSRPPACRSARSSGSSSPVPSPVTPSC